MAGRISHGMFGTPEYQAFRNALNRCVRESDPRYKSYGGRGIEMRFKTFEEFFAEIGPRPDSSLSLDRIDTNGHYEAGNIRWATPLEQAESKTTTKRYSYGGEEMTLPQWCACTGVAYKKAWRRLKDGWPFAVAVGLK